MELSSYLKLLPLVESLCLFNKESGERKRFSFEASAKDSRLFIQEDKLLNELDQWSLDLLDELTQDLICAAYDERIKICVVDFGFTHSYIVQHLDFSFEYSKLQDSRYLVCLEFVERLKKGDFKKKKTQNA